jgi:uncharacterized protein
VNQIDVITPRLDHNHRRTLLDIAARTVHEALTTGRSRLPDHRRAATELRALTATFVTLERDDDLLGCIGTLVPLRPLVVDVAHNALAAAFADPRLPPITPSDYTQMSIKISVLSDLEPITVVGYDETVNAVRADIDGLVLDAGPHRATLLPSVWPKVRHASEFAEILWRKAGLAPGDWPRGTRVARYTTEEFQDPGPR